MLVLSRERLPLRKERQDGMSSARDLLYGKDKTELFRLKKKVLVTNRKAHGSFKGLVKLACQVQDTNQINNHETWGKTAFPINTAESNKYRRESWVLTRELENY